MQREPENRRAQAPRQSHAAEAHVRRIKELRVDMLGFVICLDKYNAPRYSGSHDTVFQEPWHRGRIQRRCLQQCAVMLPAIRLANCVAEAGSTQPCTGSGRASSAPWKPTGVVEGKSEGPLQHPDQSAVPDLFPMGEWTCLRSRNHRLPLAKVDGDFRSSAHLHILAKCCSRSSSSL